MIKAGYKAHEAQRIWMRMNKWQSVDPKTNPVCNEHNMVQKAGIILSSCQKTENLRTTVRLLIEERYTWPVRAVL